MREEYSEGIRNLRYDALAVLMCERCTRFRQMGWCEGKQKACRFEDCPMTGDEDPTNPNAWVKALVDSENASWQRAFERGRKEAEETIRKRRKEEELAEKSKEAEQKEEKKKGGWFLRWLTSK